MIHASRIGSEPWPQASEPVETHDLSKADASDGIQIMSAATFVAWRADSEG